jgi:hypothetical protein
VCRARGARRDRQGSVSKSTPVLVAAISKQNLGLFARIEMFYKDALRHTALGLAEPDVLRAARALAKNDQT